jgi:hypothetical protein
MFSGINKMTTINNSRASSLPFDDCKYNNNWYGARHPFLCSSAGPDSCGAPKVSVINPDLYKQNVAEDFILVPETHCGNAGYTSEDARLKHPLRGNIPIELDKRPMDMEVEAVNTNDVYSNKWEEWKTGFANYRDLNRGQITYYVDQELAPPFNHPNFENKASVMGYTDVTPMNKIKTTYKRTPLKCRDCFQTQCRCYYLGGLSWIEDSNEQREDIMASQMWRINENKWESRWGNEKASQA